MSSSTWSNRFDNIIVSSMQPLSSLNISDQAFNVLRNLGSLQTNLVSSMHLKAFRVAMMNNSAIASMVNSSLERLGLKCSCEIPQPLEANLTCPRLCSVKPLFDFSSSQGVTVKYSRNWHGSICFGSLA